MTEYYVVTDQHLNTIRLLVFVYREKVHLFE